MAKRPPRESVADEDLSRRKALTFEQAEGIEDLPTQLKKRELSGQLRSYLWAAVYGNISRSVQRDRIYHRAHFNEPWLTIFRTKHLLRDHLMVDDFDGNPDVRIPEIKEVYANGTYAEVFGLTQWFLRHPQCPSDLRHSVAAALKESHAAYKVFDGDTIAPLSSDEEAAALSKALADTKDSSLRGPHKHLKVAAEELSNGNWAGSIRESIHAVEAVAKIIEPGASTLDPALTALAKRGSIHAALRNGFSKLYGFTSDAEGVRHSLVFEDEATVDEVDAQYMLGACAAFVSYLLSRVRNSSA